MRAVDTNVLVRLLVRDGGSQVAAAEAFVAPGAWVSTVVLAETVWVLANVYGREPSAIATAVASLLGQPALAIEHADAAAAALLRFQARPRPGFADYLIVELARKAGHLPLGTFDRGLARAPGVQRLA